jgi:hypothetical protein
MNQVNGWTITWSGWREPANQPIAIGYWLAFKPEEPEPFWCATTMGTIRQHRSWFECLDFSLQEGWPLITSRSTEHEREGSMRQALELMKSALIGLGA